MATRNTLIKRQRFATIQVRITEVSLTSVMEQQIDLADDTFEPSNVIERKAKHLAELLDISYEEAERLVIHHS